MQQRQDLYAGLTVQCAGGFVTQQHLRVLADGSGNRHTLLLTAAELGRKLIFVVQQTHLFQCLGSRGGAGANILHKLHILQCGQGGDQIVKLKHEAHIRGSVFGKCSGVHIRYRLAVHQNGAFGGAFHTAQQVQQGGFACAAGSQDHNELALFDGKAHIVQRIQNMYAGEILFGHILKFNQCHCFSSLAS